MFFDLAALKPVTVIKPELTDRVSAPYEILYVLVIDFCIDLIS